MNLYSNQLQQKPVQQMVANTIQEPPQRNFSVINTTVIEEKIDSLKSENSKILKEIKPLLKSLIDMQYYTYQSINKVNADIKVLKDEVDGLRKNFMIEEDNIKKPRQIKDELKESSPKNVKEEKKFEDSSSRERTEERKGNRIEDETTYIKMPKTPSLFEP